MRICVLAACVAALACGVAPAGVAEVPDAPPVTVLRLPEPVAAFIPVDHEAPPSEPPAEPPTEPGFKIYTMNLRTAVAERSTAEQRTAMVARVIEQEAPDVVCLQEAVEMPGLENRARALATATSYDFLWRKTFGVRGVFDEGIALLSKWPITWSDVVSLPHPDLGGQNERKAIGAGVALPEGELRAFCSHFTTDPVSSFKADQAVAVLQLLEAHPGALPAVFAGDLNATPDELAMRVLSGDAEHAGRRGALRDAWVATQPGDAGFTHPSSTPDRRIDYVWSTTTPRECHLVLREPDGEVWASDHLGVVCTFAL